MGFTGVEIPQSVFSTALVGTPVSTFANMVEYFSEKFLYAIKLFFTVIYQSAVYDYLLSIILFVLIFWLVGYLLKEFIRFISSDIAFELSGSVIRFNNTIFSKRVGRFLDYARMNFHTFLSLFTRQGRSDRVSQLWKGWPIVRSTPTGDGYTDVETGKEIKFGY